MTRNLSGDVCITGRAVLKIIFDEQRIHSGPEFYGIGWDPAVGPIKVREFLDQLRDSHKIPVIYRTTYMCITC